MEIPLGMVPLTARIPKRSVFLLLFCVGSILFTNPSALRAAATPAYRLYGLNFSPYVDGQDPNYGAVVSETQLRQRMEIVAPCTQWIRTFSCTRGLEAAGRIARSLGLKTALGAWIGRDSQANEAELANLIAAARAGEVDLAIVGSEVFYRRDLSETQLLDYIRRFKREVPSVPVAYADVYGELLAHPNMLAAVDVVFANYYPYWEGYDVEVAMGLVHLWHQWVVEAAGGKPVVVSEIGWPSAGETIRNAVPSPTNAAFFFLNFVSWARANNVAYFYFEAFDETWKARLEGSQGAHWGIWDKDGNLKPGMETVFAGVTLPDNWSGNAMPGGPGTPTIEFTYVPPYDSRENLEGRILHARPANCSVVVYIRVGSGWWVKPYSAQPVTAILVDGTWTTSITTGGVDHLATEIIAFLIPKTYTPPILLGTSTLPAELYQNSLAYVRTSRSTVSICGTVRDRFESPLGDVTITLSGSAAASTRTNRSGKYSFVDLPAGGSFIVTPSKAGYSMVPPSRSVVNLSGAQVLDFVASAMPPQISSISPATVIASPTAQTFVIVGAGFLSGLTVIVTPPSGMSFTVGSSQIRSLAPARFELVLVVDSPQAWQIRVRNPNGEESAPFTINVLACPYTATLSPLALESSGGYASLAVSTDPGCPWTLEGLPAWLTVLGSASGTGPAILTLQAQPNSEATRWAILTLPGLSLPVRQLGADSCRGVGGCTLQVLPHLAFGGQWSTEINLSNRQDDIGPFALRFYSDSGTSIELPLVDTGSTVLLEGTVPARGLRSYEAADPHGPDMPGAWALVEAPSTLVAYVTFRRWTPADMFYEAAVHGARQASSFFSFPFDATVFVRARAQMFTGFAIANLNPTSDAQLTCVLRDSEGQLFAGWTLNLTVPVMGHWAGYYFPPLLGMRGQIECTANTLVAAVALRAIGSDAFSTLPVALY